MSTYEAQWPIHVVRCDENGCTASYTPKPGFYQRSGHLARSEARDAGWDVPPSRGKGSRSPDDFCPEHKRR